MEIIPRLFYFVFSSYTENNIVLDFCIFLNILPWIMGHLTGHMNYRHGSSGANEITLECREEKVQ